MNLIVLFHSFVKLLTCKYFFTVIYILNLNYSMTKKVKLPRLKKFGPAPYTHKTSSGGAQNIAHKNFCVTIIMK